MTELEKLFRSHAHSGRVDWIGLRPERLGEVDEVATALLALDGLAGDHARPGKRALTLIQAEHLPVIAALAGRGSADPRLLRRNLVISGINLTALRHRQLRVGQAVVSITIPCAPCSRMQAALGEGGYNAMRGHSGWCAEVLEPGPVTIGDRVEPIYD